MRDSDIRKALLKKLSLDHAGDQDTKIVEEMGIWSGSVRIDVAVINGSMCGYEIKSDRDTLERLPFQAELYSKVFDTVTLVVGQKHLNKARQIIPKWWGVVTVKEGNDGFDLLKIRTPKQNKLLDKYLIAQLLWKNEAISVLDAYGLARGYKGKRVKDIHEKIASTIPLEELTHRVRSILKHRPNWLTADTDE